MAKMKTLAIPEQQRQEEAEMLMQHILKVVKSAGKYGMEVELIGSILKYAQMYPMEDPNAVLYWARKDWDL